MGWVLMSERDVRRIGGRVAGRGAAHFRDARPRRVDRHRVARALPRRCSRDRDHAVGCERGMAAQRGDGTVAVADFTKALQINSKDVDSLVGRLCRGGLFRGRLRRDTLSVISTLRAQDGGQNQPCGAREEGTAEEGEARHYSYLNAFAAFWVTWAPNFNQAG